MKEIRQKVARKKWQSQYRDRKTIMDAKAAKSGQSAATWFLKVDVTAILTVIATPNSGLQTTVKNALRNQPQADGDRAIVMEDGGVPANLGLKNRDPFSSEGCKFKD